MAVASGVLICGACGKEVHADGPNGTWQHCGEGTPMCAGAAAKAPEHESEIVGALCGAAAQGQSLADASEKSAKAKTPGKGR
jgi:hypothetical protein